MARFQKLLPLVAVAATVLTFAPIAFAPPALSPIQWTVIWAAIAIGSIATIWWGEHEAHRATKAEKDRLQAALERREAVKRARAVVAELQGEAHKLISEASVAAKDKTSTGKHEFDQKAAAWADNAFTKLGQVFGESAHQIANMAGRDNSPMFGGGWYTPWYRTMEVRLLRLHEFDMNAESLAVNPEDAHAASDQSSSAATSSGVQT